VVDKFGIYLSERMVKRYITHLDSQESVMLDLGCGYYARLLRKLLSSVALGIGVDFAIASEVKALPNIKIYEDTIENALPRFESNFFDLIVMISVLEHLTEPLDALRECKRILKNYGTLLINVPTWRGKLFLEASAYCLSLSPKSEIDDHKMYYDKRDLWPLLVKAGFRPSTIQMKYYKFGLNLFVVCRNDSGK
jgi:SAM-dependent methyltransferase